MGDIIRAFKSISTNAYIAGVKVGSFPSFKKRFWQRNYYEHIIRDDDQLQKIQDYLIFNPLKRDDDPERGVFVTVNHKCYLNDYVV